jgi:D-3-phosphoglycerate dehydrogenase
MSNMNHSPKILLVENIHDVAVQKLTEEGFQVEKINHAPSEEELIQRLGGVDVLGIRSKTEITAKVLQAHPHLSLIGAFCIGTNQIDLGAANHLGIPVFNAPHSNTRSVAELVIAELVILSRQLGDRNSLAHQGDWLKSAEGSREIRGKTLGIVGYGHIGSQVSVLAEAMGLRVLFFDVIKKLPLGNAKSCSSLAELLKQSDFVTLHVPETPQTKDMISSKELSLMKKGSHLINASRGTVVVIEDLAKALQEKHIAGCALDVFPMEPASNKERFTTPLQKIPNVFLTPHIGGSTEEAQFAIGIEVAESFRRYLKVGSTSGAVNFPQVDLPRQSGAKRLLNVHRNEPGVLGEINGVASKFGANIQAQYLATDAKIGYIVMDVERDDMGPLAQEIASLSRSIKTRVLG